MNSERGVSTMEALLCVMISSAMLIAFTALMRAVLSRSEIESAIERCMSRTELTLIPLQLDSGGDLGVDVGRTSEYLLQLEDCLKGEPAMSVTQAIRADFLEYLVDENSGRLGRAINRVTSTGYRSANETGSLIPAVQPVLPSLLGARRFERRAFVIRITFSTPAGQSEVIDSTVYGMPRRFS